MLWQLEFCMKSKSWKNFEVKIFSQILANIKDHPNFTVLIKKGLHQPGAHEVFSVSVMPGWPVSLVSSWTVRHLVRHECSSTP